MLYHTFSPFLIPYAMCMFNWLIIMSAQSQGFVTPHLHDSAVSDLLIGHVSLAEKWKRVHRLYTTTFNHTAT